MSKRTAWMCGCLVAMTMVASPARGEVKESSADGFVLTYARRIDVSPEAAYDAIGQVARWWNGKHSYSGSAANLTLVLEPGGCFCERWAGGAVEHGRVIMAMRGQGVRIAGALGPLQGMAVSAVLSMGLRADGGATMLTMTYRVNGSHASALDKLAGDVDGVLADQFSRLAEFATTGRPDRAAP